MSQSRRKLSKRNQLLVLQITRCEEPRTIQHEMDKFRREFVTFADDSGHIIAMYRDDFCRLLCDDISGWRNQPRIRHQASDVSGAPFHDLSPAGSAVDMNAQVSVQHNMQAVNLSIL